MNIHELDRYTEYICRFEPEIDSNSFYLLMLIYRKDVVSFNKYMKKKKRAIVTEEQFNNLIAKNYIFKSIPNAPEGNEILAYDVTEDFKKLVSINEEDAFNELREAYPDTVEVNGNHVAAKNVNVLTGAGLYNAVISNNRLLHFEILEIVEAYRLKFIYAKTGLDKFITNRGWEFMKTQLKNGKSNKDLVNKI